MLLQQCGCPDSRAGSAESSKELGNVTRFLNRVLGLPIHRQNLLFNYFLAVLSADIRTAKAEGRYSEGMSDLPASNISFACPPEVSSWPLRAAPPI